MSTPITEASNAITENIDTASPLEIVSLLEKCDAEIFNGFQEYQTIFHEGVIKTIEAVAGHVAEVLRDPEHGAVVFSGCGTSGRLGFVVARSFNEQQRKDGKPSVFHYVLAGGDRALFTSQEAPEDDPRVGVESLKKITEGKKKVVFIGITCGLSAPYVAGQLEFCLDHLDTFVPVLLGFNPTHLARNIQIDSWDKTFLQVVQRLEKSRDNDEKDVYILNPIVGPEPITGSSRMKSGSATKILLETVCMKAFADVDAGTDSSCNVPEVIRCYQSVYDTVYSDKATLSSIMEMAGNSLKSGGCIYYLGNDSLAVAGLIDSSECPPTYGATLDDVRGFITSGYTTLGNVEGDLSNLGKHYRISLDQFNTDIQLSSQDIVIVLNKDKTLKLPGKVLFCASKKVLITFEKIQIVGFDTVLEISLPYDQLDTCSRQKNPDAARQIFREMATKWCLNAISTGAHVLKGKVYRNIMIDVKVSNNKLFHRAVGILCKLGSMSVSKATDYLLRSIYNFDRVTDEIRSLPIAKHISEATPLERVVPTALMAAVADCTVAEARSALSAEPVIRTAVADLLKQA